MSQTEKSSIQAMYEYQRLAAPNKEEYVVRGAKVSCAYGSKDCVLNLPVDHGAYTADGRPLITVSDSMHKNISGFGYCKLIEKACTPSLEHWTYTKSSKKIMNSQTVKEEYAVTRNSTAVCKNAGSAVVLFESSGQVVADYSNKKIEGATEITEDIKKNWTRGSDGKDFLGHLNALHSGIYNFGIYKKDEEIKGTVFLYKKAKSNSLLKFIGAYELCEHKNEKKEGFKDTEQVIIINKESRYNETETKEFYWTMWIEMVLEKGIDYYFEIDNPNMNSYDYKLIGNLEQEKLILNSIDVKDDKIAAAWLIDGIYKTAYPDNYELACKENKRGIPVIVLYLDYWYRMLFEKVLYNVSVKEQKIYSNDDISSGLSVASLIIPFVGTYLSVLSLLIAYLPDTIKNQLSVSINQFSKGTIKVTIYEDYNPEAWKYHGDNPLAGVFRQNYNYEIIQYMDTVVKGETYLAGKFTLFPGFDSQEDPDTLTRSIEQSLTGLK